MVLIYKSAIDNDGALNTAVAIDSGTTVRLALGGAVESIAGSTVYGFSNGMEKGAVVELLKKLPMEKLKEMQLEL
jgi:hypothetical protein